MNKEKVIKETENKNTNTYRITCKYCNQEIKGTSEDQVNHLLLIHKMSKHKDKVEMKEIK